MKLEILHDGNEILRKKSAPVKEITPELLALIADMKETMTQSNGIGLAAPQIGKNIRLIIVATKEGERALINPEIISKSILKETDEEGCLSIPGCFVKVKRHKSIAVRALNEDGTASTFKAQGLYARVIQHEIDHLDGVLMIDRINAKDKAVISAPAY